MPIVCGTDFSPSAAGAALAAGMLAKHVEEPLVLVHALEGEAPDFPRSTAEVMSHAADALRAHGVTVAECLEAGPAEVLLPRVAARTKAMLIVLGAPERRSSATLLGSTADKIVLASRAPVLTLRDAAAFEEWLGGKRPLRAIVATDLSSASQAAVDWVASLRERELAAQAATLDGSGEVRTWLEPNLGRTAAPLVMMASQEHADLLVVGTHQRKAFDRLWQGTVSRTILRLAPMSVACVPAGEASQRADVPPIRTIVAATDFSPTGNLAVAHAYSIAPAGSHVVLLHAMKLGRGGTPDESLQLQAQEALRALIPRSALLRGIDSETCVLEGHSISAAICGGAERFGADVVVLGTEGRTGFARPVFGSVAQEVILRSRCPVLIVPPAHVLQARLSRPAREITDRSFAPH